MGIPHIKVVAGPVTKVALSRPDARNAMSDVTLRELTAAFKTIAKDKDVRAVVVTGEGKDFCAGADINWMKASGQLPPEEGKKDARLLADMLQAVDECPVPVIVAAHGNVFGGGLGLVAACYVAVLSDDAKMSFSEDFGFGYLVFPEKKLLVIVSSEEAIRIIINRLLEP